MSLKISRQRVLFSIILFVSLTFTTFSKSVPEDSGRSFSAAYEDSLKDSVSKEPETDYSVIDSSRADLTEVQKSDSSEAISGIQTTEIRPRLNRDHLPAWYDMFTNIPNDYIRFYNSEFIKENIPYYLGITVATLGLIASDEATWKASDKFYKRSPINKSISDFFTDYGDGRSQFAMAGLFAAYGLIDNNSRALRTASQIVEAVLASGAVVQVLKHLTGRESPFISAMPGGVWRFFPDQIEYHKHVAKYDAFPSGHVTTSLAAVIVVAENYPEHKWIKPVGYTFTALLGIGMVNKGIHWYSDYPLAIALGYAFGKLIANPEVGVKDTKPLADEGKKVTFNVSPYFNQAGPGLTFSMHF